MKKLAGPVHACSRGFTGLYLKLAANGWVRPDRYLPDLPPWGERAARRGHLQIELVSHCWKYAHLLVHQLNSIVRNPPRRATVTVTVYHAVDDAGTVGLLTHFGSLTVPNIVWNWRTLPKPELFRRAIGRNEAARSTRADWIWFTDCDLMMRENCFDALADALQDRRDALVFPRVEHCTSLLPDDHPLLNPNLDPPETVEIDTTLFSPRRRTRATGPLQIVHGDVARACGYCNSLPHYQTPVQKWSKAHEDRAFRWLLRTRGTPLDVPGVYRIRHASKGRYAGSPVLNSIRGWTRRIESRIREL